MLAYETKTQRFSRNWIDAAGVGMELVHHFLEGHALHTPQKTALICGTERRSYADIDRAANRLGQALLVAGVGGGDRVAIYLENSVEAVIAIFGVLKAGAVFSAINPSTKADKLAYTLRDERAAALITANDTPRRRELGAALPVAPVPLVVWVGGVPAALPASPSCHRDWAGFLAEASEQAPCVDVTEHDLGTIIYTSGTTGTPKGVMSAHRDMVFAARAITTYLENSADDVIFSALSLAFTYGLYQLITAMAVGATLVLERDFAFPVKALEVMERERVTGFPGVPTMFAFLCALKDLASFDLGSLRYVTNAAAPLPLRHIQALRAAFPQARFFSMYGQPECKRTCYLPPEELDRRPGSVGLPIPGTGVYIVDEEGHPLPPGAIGELVVRGPHLMRGYWERPEETAKRLRPGPIPGEYVLHTGDLFRMDDEGFLYFVSREDDIIKSRGEKVSPNEIENALHNLPGVRDVAVVGVLDPLLGEAIKVFVVAEEGTALTERDIRAYCARHLEDFMVPRYVEFRASLPKSGNGKTLRKDLRICVA
jgi:long-chain acyl-CoA synthetase